MWVSYERRYGDQMQKNRFKTQMMLDAIELSTHKLHMQSTNVGLSSIQDMSDEFKSMSFQLYEQKIKESQLCQKQMEDLESLVTGLCSHQKALKNNLHQLLIQFRDPSKKFTNQMAMHFKDTPMEKIKEKIEGLKDYIVSLRSWNKIPGYGEFNDIRDLRHNTLNTHRFALDEWRNLQRKLHTDALSRESFLHSLSALHQIFQGAYENTKNLSSTQEHLAKKKNQHAYKLSIFFEISSFYSNLQKIAHEMDFELLKKVQMHLHKHLCIGNNIYGREEMSSLKEVLMNFAENLDRERDQALTKNTRFVKISGDQLGVYPEGYRLATRADLGKFKAEACKEIEEWETARIEGGWAFRGRAFAYKVDKVEDVLPYTLLIKSTS